MDTAVQEQASQINALTENNVNPAGSTRSFGEVCNAIMPFPGDKKNSVKLQASHKGVSVFHCVC